MARPIETDIVIYGGVSGVPSNNTSPIGGTMDATAPLTSTPGADLASIYRGASDVVFNAIIYFQNNCTSPGTLNFARVYNRSGAIVNTVVGSLQYVSTTGDTTTIKTTGKVSGAWQQDLIVLAGTTPVTGTKIWDAGTVIRHESLTAGISAVKTRGNITISSSGQILCVMYGTDSNPTGYDFAVYTCTAEYALALASAKNTTLTAANRLTTSTGIGSFAPATMWNGADASLGVPGAALGFGEHVGVAIQYTSYTGAPEPVSNEEDHFPMLLGTPA